MDILIVSGGDISLTLLKEYVSKHQDITIIAVDRGLEPLSSLKILPSHIVGDLDSLSPNIREKYTDNPNVVFHKYKPEKDYTDTDIAIKLAIKLKATSITILGALGKRMDHALANIHVLNYALKANIPCKIIDEYNKIYLINKTTILKKLEVYGKYISLIPLTSSVSGLSLTGFKYPLSNYTLKYGKSLGVSNEIIEDVATIDFKKGILIVIALNLVVFL